MAELSALRTAEANGTLFASLRRGATYPIKYWNWKTASITAGIRALVFLLAIGHHRDGGAALVEIAYVTLTSGFFSAVQQGLLSAEPEWLANLGIVVAVPIASQTIDSLIHMAAGTHDLMAATISLMAYALISAAFHLHVMREGAMLKGAGARSFLNDLTRVPQLVASFVSWPVRRSIRLLSGSEGQGALGAEGSE